MYDVRHNCGMCVAHSLHDAYSIIKRLQHRGREAAGIACIGPESIDVVKWTGNVGRFDLEDLHKIFPGHQYHTYMAHVRYATQGKKDRILADAHPHVIGGNVFHRGDHVIIRDCDAAIVHNGQVCIDGIVDLFDHDQVSSGCDSEALLHVYRHLLEYEFMRNVQGAYTLAIADRRNKDVLVMRDRTGIRPGVLGWKDGKFCIASEDIALRRTGAMVVENLDPGSIYYLTPNGDYRSEKVVQTELAHCFFEYNYIAHVDSVLDGVPVRGVREALGVKCAEENDFDVDMVMYAPRCPKVAARRFAQVKSLPFVEDQLYKMREERSFQGSTGLDRWNSIKSNLHLAPGAENVLRGKRVLIFDDSTIRANTAKRLKHLMSEAGVLEAVLMNYTPQIGIIGDDGEPRGCTSGVDMPLDDNFVARGRNLDEISEAVGMRTLYLSVDGMLDAFEAQGIPRDHLCTFCIGGEDPFRKGG